MKFEIGEVVMIYDRESVRYVKIKTVFPDGTLTVRNYSKKEKVEFGIEYPAHPKQCRKLKPKKKLRCIWINYCPDAYPGEWHVNQSDQDSWRGGTVSSEPKHGWIKFREARDNDK